MNWYKIAKERTKGDEVAEKLYQEHLSANTKMEIRSIIIRNFGATHPKIDIEKIDISVTQEDGELSLKINVIVFLPYRLSENETMHLLKEHIKNAKLEIKKETGTTPNIIINFKNRNSFYNSSTPFKIDEAYLDSLRKREWYNIEKCIKDIVKYPDNIFHHNARLYRFLPEVKEAYIKGLIYTKKIKASQYRPSEQHSRFYWAVHKLKDLGVKQWADITPDVLKRFKIF